VKRPAGDAQPSMQERKRIDWLQKLEKEREKKAKQGWGTVPIEKRWKSDQTN